jgi:tRNA pseudouridine32 synthase / 23S rRNA pseudouridine746 synthase
MRERAAAKVAAPDRPLLRAPLPTRNGVGPSCVALPAGAWSTIAQCLMARFYGVPTAEWESRIRAGEVVDERGLTITLDTQYRAHLRVYYYRSVAYEEQVPFEETVLYRDEHIVVADKPHFLPVTPSGGYLQETLLVRLKRRLGIDTLAPVHRIDRETAGLVLFTTSSAHRGAYQALFANREVSKEYRCVAPSSGARNEPCVYSSRVVPSDHFMQMREVPGEPNATTRIEQLEQHGALALYRLQPLTGRRHQLRVQCAALGIPIVNDRIYPALQERGSDDHARPLQLLAQSLSFVDPVSGAPHCFVSRLALQWPPTGETTRADQ